MPMRFLYKIEKHRIPKESPTRQNCKIMLARFDWVCSWTGFYKSLHNTKWHWIITFHGNGYSYFIYNSGLDLDPLWGIKGNLKRGIHITFVCIEISHSNFKSLTGNGISCFSNSDLYPSGPKPITSKVSTNQVSLKYLIQNSSYRSGYRFSIFRNDDLVSTGPKSNLKRLIRYVHWFKVKNNLYAYLPHIYK
jgi:hypothetical protein